MLNFSFAQEYVQLDLFDEFRETGRYEVVREYIETLTSNKAKPILDVMHLSKIVGFNNQFLFSVSASPSQFYREFKIAKKSGGTRTLHEPLPTLKIVQKTIADDILRDVEPHKAAKAFRKNHTLRGNAVIHRRRPFMLKLDIKDFFPSIDAHKIYTLLFDIGYTRQVSRLLTGLCTLNNGLPQGAPTSPMLSNLVMRDFDSVIFEYCINNDIFYTRYADDMAFSAADDRVKSIIPFVRGELKKCGLEINKRKTSFSGTGARKYVTGIVVNERLNILREDRKKLRQEMYYIRKFGINGHLRKINSSGRNYLDGLAGRLNFAFFVTKEPQFLEDKKYLQELKKII